MSKKQSKNTHNRAHAFFKKEATVIAWLASAVIIMLLANATTIQARFNRINERQAAEVPKASQNIGILEFTWKDNFGPASGAYQAQIGSRAVAITTQVLNLQERNVWLEPHIESYIVDDKSNTYKFVDMEVQKPFTSGIYGPQMVASGTLTYVIPRDVSGPKWCYELAPINGGGEPVCVALNKYSQER